MMVNIECSLACDIDLIDNAFAVDFNPKQVGPDIRHFNYEGKL